MPNFSVMAEFRALDLTGRGYVDKASIIALFQSFGAEPEANDLDSILRRLDTDDDERLSYAEFVEALMPSKLQSEDIARITAPYPAPSGR